MNGDDGSEAMEKKENYFQWTCDKCGWGARAHHEQDIIKIKKQHDELGCKEFASMIESQARRII
jgi:RNase P subunit RPR2